MKLVDDFMALCLDFLQQDASVPVSIEEFFGDLWVEEGILHFSLPAVYQYLIHLSDNSGGADYKGFRQALYSSDFNSQLTEQGGKVEVHKSSGKVDSTIYKLAKI